MARWLAILLLSGCAGLDRARLDEALRREPQDDPVVRERYVLHPPDVVAVAATGAEPWDVVRPVGVDGRIDLPRAGTVRVQGKTLADARRAIAATCGVPAGQVKVEVKEFHSQHVFVHGRVAGADRAVEYRGPETVLDVLRRAGGLDDGAVAVVRLVRGHVAEGRSPEVFDIDLRAILLRSDTASNVRVEPFDQIYIDPDRRSEFVANLPPAFRPSCAYLFGLRRAK